MKNKSLIILVAIATVIFGGLIFSVWLISSKDKPVFYADGYVSLTSSENTEKIYFKEGTTYKKGYNKEIEFKNSDNEDAKASIYSFVFYNNRSIGFLSDGVLMDLNKVNDAFIPYYNIKSNYLVEYTSGLYTIHASDKDVVLSNFISRITDEKFLVAGNDVKLKLSSSENYINGTYFELIFSEGTDGNIVKIDNADLSIETISDECYILIGDNIKIDLSNRTILYDSEVKVNLDEIIIDHNENIDILYEDITVDDGGDGSGEGEGDEGNVTEPPVEEPPLEWTEQVETVVDYKRVPYVEILSSSANATSINLSFNVIDENSLISGPVYVRYLNKKTLEGRTIEYANYAGTIDFASGTLEANTDYIVTIYTSYIKEGRPYGNHVMFQRTFTTTDMGVEIERDYVTSTEIAYNLNFDGSKEFTSGTITLYDDAGNVVASNTFENLGSTVPVIFSELDPNKSYTAKIENVMMDNTIYSLKEPIVATDKTLKYNPFTDAIAQVSPIATVNKKDYNFTFELGTIEDKNNAIKSVKYEIYNFEDNTLVKTITKDHVNPIIVEVDDDIKTKTTYHYRAIVTLHDGEKEIDYTTMYSNTFNLSNKISPTMRFDMKEISANTVNGLFKIYDPDNALDVNQNVYVEYSSAQEETKVQNLTLIDCPSEEESTTKCAELNLIDLTSDQAYTINLMGFIDLESEDIPASFDVIGSMKITTERADVIKTTMSATELDENESLQKFFELNMQFALEDGTSESVRDNMSGFDIFLYEGYDATGSYLGYIHVGENIANDYFLNQKTLTLADFGLTLQSLQEKHLLEGTKISKTYSIVLRNGRTGADHVVFSPNILNFEINDVLLGLTSTDASINVTEIKNNSSSEYYDANLNYDTTIGFRAVLDFGNKDYANEINYIIYDVTSGSKVVAVEHQVKDLDLDSTSPNPEIEFYFADYADKLVRGHTYIVSYTVGLDLNNDKTSDIVFPFSPDDISEAVPVESVPIDVYKQLPTMVLFAWTSSADSITYKFDVTDLDKSLPDGYPVKIDVAGESKTGTFATCGKSSSVGNYTSKYRCVTFEGLNNNDVYSVYLEAHQLERALAEPTKTVINDFTFETVYSDLQDVKFDMVVNEEGNNRYTNLVALKISETYDGLTEEEKVAAEELKRRISHYTVTLTSETGERFVINNINNSTKTSAPMSTNLIDYYEAGGTSPKATWNSTKGSDNVLQKAAYVSLCEDGVSTCLYIDYSKLYNSTIFKTAFNGFKNKSVSVSVSAVYDTGKVGYLAYSDRNYTFQVKSNADVKYGSILYNDYYFQVNGSRQNQSAFNPNAMATYYAYTLSSANGFVDDGVSDNSGYTGSMTFANKAFNNLALANITSRFNIDYLITKSGVEINAQNVRVPILAKELGTTVISGSGTFSYDKVIPGISVIGTPEATVNGLKFRLQISGLTEEDVVAEDNIKYVYLEVYNESDKLIKTLKVNKEALSSQSGVIKDNKFTLKADDDYKFDISTVSIGGAATTDYDYDYKTGVITFKDIVDDTEITVDYRIVVDDLNTSSNYYLKAFMKMGASGSKNYLVDITSPIYAAYVYNFTTLAPTALTISNAQFEVESLSDYKTRNLITTYNISDIIGIDDLTYKICNEDGSVCVDTTNYTKCTDSYNNFGGTCFEHPSGYTARIKNDISITDDYDFIFNTNYNFVVSAKITEENGANTYEIYNSAHSVKALENPVVTVTKDSNQKAGNYYLTFTVKFDDPDRVVYAPKDGEKNGYYVAYLVDGNRNKVNEVLDENGKTVSSESIIEIAPDGQTTVANLYYGGLQANSSYYLMIEYRTYRNNADLASKIENFAVPYLIYTLDDDNVSVGMIDYIATDNLTTLRFGYATNIMKRYIPNPNGEGTIPDPDQEAYVGGIAYTIRRLSGDATFEISDVLMFDENNPITYVTGDTSSTVIGDEYYQMQIKGTQYTDEAFYIITFKFYLGGNVTAGLDETTCAPEGSTNKWFNGECYTLGNITYQADALYGGAAK